MGPLDWLFDRTVAIEKQDQSGRSGGGAPKSGWAPVAGYGAEPCQLSQATPEEAAALAMDRESTAWKVAFGRPAPFGLGYRLAWPDPESGRTRYLVGLGPARPNQGLTWVAFARERPGGTP